ncbi:MAG: hypothetical protein LUE11_08530 [Clostridia bacterium]|nr:hypothetical protein [Clostridia bacterium]
MKPIKPNYWIYIVLLFVSFIPTILFLWAIWKFSNDNVVVTRCTLILSFTVSVFTSTLVACLIDVANCRAENKKVDIRKKILFEPLKRSIRIFLDSFALVCTKRTVTRHGDLHEFGFWLDKVYQEHLWDNDLFYIVIAAADVVSRIDEIDERGAYLIRDDFLNKEQLVELERIRSCCLKVLYDLQLKIEDREKPENRERARFVLKREDIKRDLKNAFLKVDFLREYNERVYGYFSKGIETERAYRVVYNQVKSNKNGKAR